MTTATTDPPPRARRAGAGGGVVRVAIAVAGTEVEVEASGSLAEVTAAAETLFRRVYDPARPGPFGFVTGTGQLADTVVIGE